jgi:hypothetical protein
MTETKYVRGSLFVGAASPGTEIKLQSIEWTENVSEERHFTADAYELESVTTGQYFVSGRFIVKSKTSALDTYLATPRVAIPYFVVKAYDSSGNLVTFTFNAPVYVLGVAVGKFGIPPAVQERTYNFVAKSVTMT